MGRTEEAEAVLQRFERQAEGTRLAWALAAAARCRGILAEEDAFEEAFAEAVRWHELTATPFERARTELCLGERRRRSRRRAEARRALRSALAMFERLGAPVWAERARRELEATGEKRARRAERMLDALTTQELQVALTVAGGATNRETAAARSS